MARHRGPVSLLDGRIRLLPEYRNWLASSDNWLTGKAFAENSDAPFRITFPLPGTRFFLDPDLPAAGRRIALRTEGAPRAEWHSDTLQCQPDGEQALAILDKGQHRLEAHDPRTHLKAETRIEVLER